MSEDERTTYKVITLKGSDNYEDWKLSILSVLALQGHPRLCQDHQGYHGGQGQAQMRANALLSSSSHCPRSSPRLLPANVRNPLDPKAALLWDHLEKTFSAKVGARQATLVQELFRTAIPEGEDPMPHLSKLQSAHAQLNSGGRESLGQDARICHDNRPS